MPSFFHSTFSRFTHVVAYIRLISSYNWIVFHFMDRANFIYPVIVWWTFGLFSLLGYYESCCYKYLCTNFCVDIMFSVLLRIHVEVEVLRQMVILFNIFSSCHAVFQTGCTVLHSLQQCMRVPIFPQPHQHFIFLLFKLYFYLFLFSCAGSLLLRGLFSGFSEQKLFSSCSVRASHWVGFSYYRAQALGLAGFSSGTSQDLEHRLNSCGTQV